MYLIPLQKKKKGKGTGNPEPRNPGKLRGELPRGERSLGARLVSGLKPDPNPNPNPGSQAHALVSYFLPFPPHHQFPLKEPGERPLMGTPLFPSTPGKDEVGEHPGVDGEEGGERGENLPIPIRGRNVGLLIAKMLECFQHFPISRQGRSPWSRQAGPGSYVQTDA
jgi:hypothetical protein